MIKTKQKKTKKKKIIYKKKKSFPPGFELASYIHNSGVYTKQMLNIIAIMHVDVKQASLITNSHFKTNDHAQRAGKCKNF